MTIIKTHLGRIKELKDNTCKDYSISKILRENKKSNDLFETMLCNISLEDVIALRLELAYKAIGVRLYGFPLWRSTNYIVQEGLLKYLIGFRLHQGFHEHCVEQIFMDLLKQCSPSKLLVLARYTRRGGIDINPWRSNFSLSKMPSNARNARQ